MASIKDKFDNAQRSALGVALTSHEAAIMNRLLLSYRGFPDVTDIESLQILQRGARRMIEEIDT